MYSKYPSCLSKNKCSVCCRGLFAPRLGKWLVAASPQLWSASVTVVSCPVAAAAGGAPCPPTPSRMAGTATSYQFDDRHEERGDIIQFYNQVFVEKVKAFVSKFSKGDVSGGGRSRGPDVSCTRVVGTIQHDLRIVTRPSQYKIINAQLWFSIISGFMLY